MSVKSSSSLALACLILLFSAGCASSGVAKLVTVDGKHLLAKSCTERQRLEEAIAEVQERRRPLTEEITQARKAVAEVGRPLKLSSVAVEGPRGGFRCAREVDLQAERPPLALPEEQARILGWAACAGRELEAAAACGRAEQRFGAVGFACEPTVKLLRGDDLESVMGDLGVLFLQLVGESARQQGNLGEAVTAEGLAALLQLYQLQACTDQVAGASHDLYRVWSFERRYLGREDELIALCEEWRRERSRRLDRLGSLDRQDREIEQELAALRQELHEVEADIDRWDLRCP